MPSFGHVTWHCAKLCDVTWHHANSATSIPLNKPTPFLPTAKIYVSRICVRSWGHALGLRYKRGQKFSIFQGTMLVCQQRTMLNCQQPRGTVRQKKTSHSDVFTWARFYRNGGMIQIQTNNRTIDLGAIT